MQVNDMLSFDIWTVHNFLQFRGGSSLLFSVQCSSMPGSLGCFI